MKNLIIVESPTKAKTLTRFLGKDYRVVSTMGHIRDLPPKKLAIDIKNNFKPEYVLLPQKKEAIKTLKQESKKAKKIFLATDPDREGEAIAWHVAFLLKKKEDGLARIVFHEITRTAVEKALKNPRGIDVDLVNAQQARRILDRLVGYKLSPLLWFKIRKGLSAGRVQSPAVRLIVEREREIEKFIPEEYWEIWADLKRHLGGKLPEAPIFAAKLIKKNGKTIKIEDKTGADEVVGELKLAGYEVAEVIQKEVKRSPAPPFITSTLQRQAANRFGWTPKGTMRVAQRLYEQGLITYHRTDSTNIAEEAIQKARKLIEEKYGPKFLPEQPRRYKTKSKVAQEAHEAIRPTSIEKRYKDTERREEERLYDLIWKRFIASQMTNAIFDETKVEVLATSKVNYYLLEAIGRVMKFAGWLILYSDGKGETVRAHLPAGEAGKATSVSSGNSVPSVIEGVSDVKRGSGEGTEGWLPELKEGDELDLVKIRPEQKFTQPPARYNEASLIKALEDYGIGRPSTYAPIISTIQERQYVEKIEKRFQPTPLGFATNDFLVEYFPDIVDFKFTAQMEDDLDKIAEGKKKWVAVLDQFYQPFGEKVKAVSRVAEKVPVATEATDETCPECGAPLVIRIGKFGKFLSCSKFPECKFTKNYLPEAGFDCEKCGSPMVVKKSRKGKTFFGCSRWPDCDFASWRKPTKKKE